MARKRLPPNNPREWLNRARSNLVRAQQIKSGVYLEDLCFDAQQAAEKAVKGVFIHRGETFPYVHNLKELLELLQTNGVKIPKYVWKAQDLSPYAYGTRYPSSTPEVKPREYHRLVRIAEAVVGWATRQIEGRAP